MSMLSRLMLCPHCSALTSMIGRNFVHPSLTSIRYAWFVVAPSQHAACIPFIKHALQDCSQSKLHEHHNEHVDDYAFERLNNGVMQSSYRKPDLVTELHAFQLPYGPFLSSAALH